MTALMFVAVVVGLFLALMIVFVLFMAFREEEQEDRAGDVLEADNDEYDYGHNVDHHFLDGEGDL